MRAVDRRIQNMERTRKRRWWQFGLRDLLWLILVAGLIMGWWMDRSRLADENAFLRWENEQFVGPDRPNVQQAPKWWAKRG
jgi:hypothetical protein